MTTDDEIQGNHSADGSRFLTPGLQPAQNSGKNDYSPFALPSPRFPDNEDSAAKEPEIEPVLINAVSERPANSLALPALFLASGSELGERFRFTKMKITVCFELRETIGRQIGILTGDMPVREAMASACH